jgi:hypothetical protein
VGLKVVSVFSSWFNRSFQNPEPYLQRLSRTQGTHRYRTCRLPHLNGTRRILRICYGASPSPWYYVHPPANPRFVPLSSFPPLVPLSDAFVFAPIVYSGMVIGATPTAGSLNVNPCLKKQLTNVRAAGADEKIVISSPKIMSLEEMIAYMSDDELVEVTPKNLRLRKAILDPKKRKR